MTRTDREYEQIFEDLMDFSRYKHLEADKILGDSYEDTNQNLRDMFGDIHEDKSAKKGKNIRVTQRFAYKFGLAFWRLVGKGKSRREVFSQAGGHDLKQDRRQTTKEVVTKRDEYARRGAREVDLEGFDTKPKRQRKGLTKVSFKRRGKPTIRFRDSKGRFAKRW